MATKTDGTINFSIAIDLLKVNQREVPHLSKRHKDKKLSVGDWEELLTRAGASFTKMPVKESSEESK